MPDNPPDADAEEALKVLEATVDQLADGEVREGQRKMCTLVAKALANADHIAVQAGTGVGKSLAYGAPAGLQDQRVVISTATKALQDQLKNTDLPMITKAVRTVTSREPVVAMLKGRSNYLCRNRVERLRGLPAARLEHLRRIIHFADHTSSGDKADLDFLPDEKTWRHVSVTSTECLGKSECEFGETCFTELARRRAGEADVVVVNHALYAWGLARGGNTIPFHQAVVIDEAHEFVGYVRNVASLTISQSRLDDLARQARDKCDPEVLDELRAAGAKLTEALAGRRDDLPRVRRQELAAGESEVAVALRVAEHHVRELLAAVNSDLEQTLDLQWDDDISEHRMLRNAITSLIDDFLVVKRTAASSDAQNLVFIVQKEGRRGTPEFHGVPLSVGDFVREHLHPGVSVVLTSATLDRGLPHDLGIGDSCRHEAVESPFDYEENSLLYVPPGLPEPNREEYRERMLCLMKTLIGEAGGRTLALFTSWKALHECYDDMTGKDAGLPDDIHVYRQGGELTNHDLVKRLRTDPTTVVCATMTFWQGVDIPGDGLELLILDKLPFPAPFEPMHRALAEHLEEYGGDAFKEMSLPHAAVMLAQGLGRLIRKKEDRGVAVVLDPRLALKEYRHRLLELVPPMRRTTRLDDALEFLRDLRNRRRH